MNSFELFYADRIVDSNVSKAHREVQVDALARLAEGKSRQRPSIRWGELRCRALDMLVGVGFALERCTIQPLQAANR